MTVTAWPDDLNYLLDRGSFRLDPQDELERTDFDEGPARVRTTNILSPSYINATITLRDTEWLMFKAFWSDINKGASWFDMPLWDGFEYQICRCRFKGKFASADGPGYSDTTLSVTIEARQYMLPQLDAGSAWLVNQYGYDFILWLFAALEIALDAYMTITTEMPMGYFVGSEVYHELVGLGYHGSLDDIEAIMASLPSVFGDYST